MTKKRKYHDPMKTVTDEIHCLSGVVTRVTRKEKHTKGMERISDKQQQIINAMLQEAPNLKNDSDIEAVLKKYSRIGDQLHAKRAAMFLIANNIARRGKPLHPDTAIKKLNARRFKGSMHALIKKWDIEESTVTDWPLTQQAEQNLHYFLYHDFGVTLMDKSVYDCCIKKIKEYKACGIYQIKNLRHYENFVKKFHKNVINEKGR